MTSKMASGQDPQPGSAEAGVATLPSPRSSGPALTIVIPCHNEEQVLPETAQRLGDLLAELAEKELVTSAAILCVDDGSKDSTWQVIERLALQDPRIHGLKPVAEFRPAKCDSCWVAHGAGRRADQHRFRSSR